MADFNTYRRRNSLRLQGYDYSRCGLYFVTLCCHNRWNLFGKIINGQMILNDSGKMADTCWKEIPRHYPQVVLHRHIIMPNHIHGIIELTDISVKAEDIPPVRISDFDINNRAENIPPQPIIGSIIKGFKIGVTKWFRDNTNIQSVWQRSYHDHIIRSEHAYWRISEYIENNPIQWKKDTFHKS